MSLLNIVENNLEELNLSLPDAPKPGGNYVSVNMVKDIAYVAIQLPKMGEDFLYRGRLCKEFTTEEGYKAAELCALNVLSVIHTYVGFKKILALNHFDAYYQSTDEWDDGPALVNGASDLFTKVLGDAGKHSRAIFGVHKMPRNFAVGITATFTLK